MYKSYTATDYKQHFSLPTEYSVSGFLSCGTWDEQKSFDRLCLNLDGLGIEYKSKKLEGFLGHIYEITINNKIYWFTVLYGGAMLSEYAHLACLFGSGKNIHIGSCGGLYPEMNSLDFLIPYWSYGNDSVTRSYGKEIHDHKHFSDRILSQKLIEKITLSNKVWEGPVMNCQAMLGETWEDVQTWSQDGYYGVEMETSTVFSVSNHYKVPCAAIMYVSDNLIKGQTVGDESHRNEKDLREIIKNEVYKVGIGVLLE